jgi:hypothetical protein
MRKLLAALLLLPVTALVSLSRRLDREPSAKYFTGLFFQIADETGLELVEKSSHEPD